MPIVVSAGSWYRRCAVGVCSLLMGCRLASCAPAATEDTIRPRLRATLRPTTAHMHPPPSAAPLAISPRTPAANDRNEADNSRALASETETPSPAAEGQPVEVEIETDPDIGRTPLTVHFSAVIADDISGEACEWDFDDGSALARGRAVSHTYTQAGAYTAKLVLTFSDGRSVTKDAPVQVDASEQSPSGD